MPDLQPDMSVYSRLAPPPGVGSMSLSDLIGLAQRTREYNTQTSLSDALKGAADPNDPTNVDFAKAQQSFVQDPRSIVTPGALQGISSANTAQLGLNTQRVQTASDALLSLIGHGPNVKGSDVLPLIPVLSRYDPQMIPTLTKLTANMPPDGKPLLSALTDLYNTRYGGAGMPTTAVPNPSGGTTQVPAAIQNRANLGLNGQGAGGSALPGAGGVGYSTLPAGATGAMETYAKEGVALRDGAPQIQQQKTMLSELDNLSREATTGPTAGFDKRVSQFAQRYGYTGTLTKDQLSSSEEYAKIAETLVGNMAAQSHGTDAYLNNAYGSNPNLELSKLGRSGITHWLQGNVDAQSLMQSEWSKYLQANPGREQDYQNWLYAPQSQGGFDVRSFDPRVFQYERMAPEEQAKFQAQMSRKGELARFAGNVRDYEQRGWTGPGNGP
jgi:hypothetical protein